MTLEELRNIDAKQILPHYFDDCFRLRYVNIAFGTRARHRSSQIITLQALINMNITDESIRLPERNYLFPTPKLLHLSQDDIIADFKKELKPQVKRQVSDFLSDQTVFCEDKAFIDSIRSQLESCGVRAVANMYSADVTILITATTDSIHYSKAFYANILMGTQKWMTDALTQQTLAEPDTLLYRPLPPRKKVLANCIISISNYIGTARQDISSMAKILGATITRDMSLSNTHLICSTPSGDKYWKAMGCDIHIVNHLWLEECFQRNIKMHEGKSFYTHLIPSLVDMVGTAKIPRWVPSELRDSNTHPMNFFTESHGDDSVPNIEQPLHHAGLLATTKKPEKSVDETQTIKVELPGTPNITTSKARSIDPKSLALIGHVNEIKDLSGSSTVVLSGDHSKDKRSDEFESHNAPNVSTVSEAKDVFVTGTSSIPKTTPVNDTNDVMGYNPFHTELKNEIVDIIDTAIFVEAHFMKDTTELPTPTIVEYEMSELIDLAIISEAQTTKGTSCIDQEYSLRKVHVVADVHHSQHYSTMETKSNIPERVFSKCNASDKKCDETMVELSPRKRLRTNNSLQAIPVLLCFTGISKESFDVCVYSCLDNFSRITRNFDNIRSSRMHSSHRRKTFED